MRLCLGEFSYHAGPFVTDSSASLSSAKPLSSPAEFGRPRQTLGIADVLAITVGIVIGAGIFRTPALVAGAAGGDETLLLAVWALGGLLSIIGALCYAELASAYPNMGGDYHFLGRAYGQRTAFFYAWARLAVIQTGSLALLAYVFADYMVAILPASGPPVLWAAIAVIGVSALNWLGVRQGAAAQKWLTIAEVVGLIVVIVAGLLLAPEGAAPRPVTGESAVGMMMIFVLLTYGGWNEAVYVSAEMKNAPRRIAPVMVGGLLIVTVLYLLANMAFLRVLGIGGMAETDAVAAGVMNAAMGDAGAAIVSLIIAVAALTSANATALTGARTTCALGRRFSLLSWLGKWDVKRDTPGNAMIAQGLIALLLVLAGAFARNGFQLAVDYTAPVFWLFLLLTGLSLFVLRAKEPDRPRPFRVPLYPITPAIFCATTAYLLWSSVIYTGWGAFAGVAVLVVGGAILMFMTPNDDDPEEMTL
jgi:basic amino acid/polyamine antiporter, APA family